MTSIVLKMDDVKLTGPKDFGSSYAPPAFCDNMTFNFSRWNITPFSAPAMYNRVGKTSSSPGDLRVSKLPF